MAMAVRIAAFLITARSMTTYDDYDGGVATEREIGEIRDENIFVIKDHDKFSKFNSNHQIKI